MAAPSVNLLSWLRPETVHVYFCDRAWQLRASTALDWLGAIALDTQQLAGVFPGLIADEDLDNMLQLMRDPSNLEGMTQVATKVLQAAGGRDWWWTLNLSRKAISAWAQVNGILVRQGVRTESIGLPDWLDACYSMLWERGDENQKAALDAELSIVPAGMRVRGKAARQMLAAFQAD